MKKFILHLPYSLLVMRESIILVFITFLCFSCGKEKVILLPEIDHSEITELQDVSAAYLFYDETKPDSVELNRKNLISTTNWLINVDKRLTLKQVIPHIKFLQEKKANSSHKNKDSKNYFTCNDTSRKNLGFNEFTDTKYIVINAEKNSRHMRPPMSKEEAEKHSSSHKFSFLPITINKDKNIILGDEFITLNQFPKKLDIFLKKYNNIGFNLEYYFDKNLKFQDYISIKNKLKVLQSNLITFDINEYIY